MKTQGDFYQEAERAVECARAALDDCWTGAERVSDERECLVQAHGFLSKAKLEVMKAGSLSKESRRKRKVLDG